MIHKERAYCVSIEIILILNKEKNEKAGLCDKSVLILASFSLM